MKSGGTHKVGFHPYTKHKNKLRLSSFDVKFPVYDYVVRVVATSDIGRAMLQYKHTKNIDIDLADTGGLHVHAKGEGLSYIFLPLDCKAGSVVHESWHAVRTLMDYAGVELENETVAYHLGYLSQQIFDKTKWKKQ